MTCADIMTSDPTVLHPQDTVERAIDLLLEQRLLALPVVAADGTYLGMFAKSRLFGLLLPVVVAIEQMLPQVAKIPDLDFLQDYLPDMQERLALLAKHAVGDYADKTVPVLHPESPVIAAILLVYRTRNFVPVVEAKSGKLVGMISTWSALAKLREQP